MLRIHSRLMAWAFLSVLFITSFSTTYANEKLPPRTLTGKVTDSTGKPLSGVNVIVKGSARGTTTSSTGDYTLENVSDNDILVFSFTGFTTENIAVGDKPRVDMILHESFNPLNEVVVVGYGKVKKRDLTGSVS